MQYATLGGTGLQVSRLALGKVPPSLLRSFPSTARLPSAASWQFISINMVV
jgi:hypothetical protein